VLGPAHILWMSHSVCGALRLARTGWAQPRPSRTGSTETGCLQVQIVWNHVLDHAGRLATWLIGVLVCGPCIQQMQGPFVYLALLACLSLAGLVFSPLKEEREQR